MNRSIAPDIKPILSIDTRFPDSTNNLFRINSEEGVSKLEIVFPSAGQAGISNKFALGMAVNLLLSGNANKSAADIANEIDALGGYVFKSADYYSSGITIYGLNENISKILEIVKNAFDTVDYSENEIEIYKRNRLSELNINLQKTSFLAGRGINQMLCGVEHSISFKLTEEIINSTSREDLLTAKNTLFQSPYFIFTGSASAPVQEMLESNGFTIGEFNETLHKDEVPISENVKEQMILKEGSTQNSLRMGCVFPERSHPDYFKLSLLNLVLGGYFGSRLMKNIREDKGLTYGIQSSITPYNNFSLFKISCEYNAQFNDELRTEIGNEIARLKNELIGDEELTVAKNYFLGVLLRSFDGAFQISEKFKGAMDSNIDKSYYNSYFKAINTISADDLLKTANNYFKENTLSYCLAGV
ncbi:MAG: insulinase family protein [Bacteroidota bacterium]